jgi:FG-GAP-like repeat
MACKASVPSRIVRIADPITVSVSVFVIIIVSALSMLTTLAAAQLTDRRESPALVSGTSASHGNFRRAVTYDSGGVDPNSVAIADVNGDGKPDLIVANCSYAGVTSCASDPNLPDGVVAILFGNGDGTFETPVIYDSGGLDATSVAVADVNHDGVPDLIVANCGPSGNDGCADGVVGVLLGNGNGTFQPAVVYRSGGVSAVSVKVADVNGDGNPDIIVANFFNTIEDSTSGAIGVLPGNGDGTFQTAVAYTTGGIGATGVALADLRGNNKLDLIVSLAADCPGSSDGCVGVLLGNGDATFQPVVTYATGGDYTSVAIADVDGDGRPDAIVTKGIYERYSRSDVEVLVGNGDGTLQPPVVYDSGGKFSQSVAVASVNGDGKPDLIVANQCVGGSKFCSAYGTVGVLLDHADGAFGAPDVYLSGGADAIFVTAGDVNGDGKPDIVVANNGSGTVSVLLSLH